MTARLARKVVLGAVTGLLVMGVALPASADIVLLDIGDVGSANEGDNSATIEVTFQCDAAQAGNKIVLRYKVEQKDPDFRGVGRERFICTTSPQTVLLTTTENTGDVHPGPARAAVTATSISPGGVVEDEEKSSEFITLV